MNLHPIWNRRTFLTTLGLTGAAALPAAKLAASTGEPLAPVPSRKAPPTHVFLSFVQRETAVPGGGLLAYTVENGIWSDHWLAHRTRLPETLVAHPTLPILYLAGPEPAASRRGSVRAISVADTRHGFSQRATDGGHHSLQEIGRQPLALAATAPRSLAISPDASRLLVADSEGGQYNILPLAADGSLLPVQHALKQTASPETPGIDPFPCHMLVHPGRRVCYGTERDADRLNLLLFCPESDHPRVTRRLSFRTGSRPSHLAIPPAAHLLFLALNNPPAVDVFPLDPQSGYFDSPLRRHVLDAGESAGPLAVNQAGDRLYAVTHRRSAQAGLHTGSQATLHTLRLAGNGRLTPLARTRLPGSLLARQLAFLGPDLLVVGNGGLRHVALDQRTGIPGDIATHASECEFTGVVLRPA